MFEKNSALSPFYFEILRKNCKWKCKDVKSLQTLICSILNGCTSKARYKL